MKKPHFHPTIRLKEPFKRPEKAILAPKTQKNKKSWAEICTNKKIISIFALAIGEMPEWSIGPHSKCGERATVPGVRIPLSPQAKMLKSSERQDANPAVFYLKEVASARNKFLRQLPLSNKSRKARTRCLHLRAEIEGLLIYGRGVARLIVFYFQW